MKNDQHDEINLFQKLNDIAPYLKRSQSKIAEAVMEKPRDVLKMTISEFSLVTGTAASTIVFFCQKLGFSGFRDFKIALAQELELIESMKVNFNELPATTKNFVKFIIENTQKALNAVPDELYKKAASLLLKTDIVEIFAYGFDAIAAKDIFIKLKHIGFQVNFYSNSFMQAISAASLTKNSCAFAIASNYSIDILDSIEIAHSHEAKVIAIVPSSSKIGKKSDIFFPVYLKSNFLLEDSMLAKYVQLFIIDNIYLKLLELGKNRFEISYKEFENILSMKRKKINTII
jgi:RpiR family carbohydrate utilization transcriptional regulator